jgi:hypothetical protein
MRNQHRFGDDAEKEPADDGAGGHREDEHLNGSEGLEVLSRL